MGSTGFTRKSKAPDFMAVTAVSMSSCAVMTTTSTSSMVSRTFSRSSRPVMPDMRTSVTIRPGSNAFTRDSAFSALSAVSTS